MNAPMALERSQVILRRVSSRMEENSEAPEVSRESGGSALKERERSPLKTSETPNSPIMAGMKLIPESSSS